MGSTRRSFIDLQGIRHGGRTLPWPTIVALGAAEGIVWTKVTIRTRGGVARTPGGCSPTRPFPNQWLLVTIAGALNVD